MESQCGSYAEHRFKGGGGADAASWYTTKRMGWCVAVSIALVVAILAPTIAYVVYNESGADQQAQQLLHAKQADENNYLLQIRRLEEAVDAKRATEQRLSASLAAQLDKSKAELKTLEAKHDGQVERLQVAYDKQLGALQTKLNVQIEQNRVYYQQIVQLHGDHLTEIAKMLAEFKDAQRSLDDVDGYVRKSKEKLKQRFEALNREREKITSALKKMNGTIV